MVNSLKTRRGNFFKNSAADEKAQYKSLQQLRLGAIITGTKDINGNEITRIYVKANEYVIYEISTNYLSESIKVYIDTEEDKDVNGIIKNFDLIRGSFGEFKSILYKVQNPGLFKSRAAHLISQALYGNTTYAISQLNGLITDINRSYSDQFKHRLRYLITALIFVVVNISVSILTYVNSYSLLEYIDLSIYIATAGSVGGFISISKRLQDTLFENEVLPFMFVIYAIERIFISIFAAFIVYFAIKSNFAFGVVNELDNPVFGYILFAIVAGFSETLVPNLLIKLEEKQ